MFTNGPLPQPTMHPPGIHRRLARPLCAAGLFQAAHRRVGRKWQAAQKGTAAQPELWTAHQDYVGQQADFIFNFAVCGCDIAPAQDCHFTNSQICPVREQHHGPFTRYLRVVM